jgi:hypothetical protein
MLRATAKGAELLGQKFLLQPTSSRDMWIPAHSHLWGAWVWSGHARRALLDFTSCLIIRFVQSTWVKSPVPGGFWQQSASCCCDVSLAHLAEARQSGPLGISCAGRGAGWRKSARHPGAKTIHAPQEAATRVAEPNGGRGSVTMHFCFVTHGDVETLATMKRATGMAEPLAAAGHSVSLVVQTPDQSRAPGHGMPARPRPVLPPRQLSLRAATKAELACPSCA